jgi:hypothetical protein
MSSCGPATAAQRQVIVRLERASVVSTEAGHEVGRARPQDLGHGDAAREGDIGPQPRTAVAHGEDVAGARHYCAPVRDGPGAEVRTLQDGSEIGSRHREASGGVEMQRGAGGRAFEEGGVLGVADRAVRGARGQRIQEAAPRHAQPAMAVPPAVLHRREQPGLGNAQAHLRRT